MNKEITCLEVDPFILLFLQSEPEPIDLLQHRSRLEHGIRRLWFTLG